MKDLFLAGVGIFSLTREQIEEIVDKLVSLGEVSRTEAALLVKQLGERAESERRSLEKLIRKQIDLAVKDMGVVKSAELNKVSDRIERLEKLLD